MISKMIPGDVFSDTRQKGERRTYITCGTNTGGFNDPEGNSVAGHIGRVYTPEFVSLGEGMIGQIHVKEFLFHDRIAQVIGIVCNDQSPGNWQKENSSDWSQAGSAVLQGFTKIQDLLSPEIQSAICSGTIRDIKESARLATQFSLDLIPKVQSILDEYNARLNPIVRSVLIGSGDSGRENDANVAEILKAMQESPANIHLYLQAQEQMAQVARVVPLFPDVGALAAVPGYDYIRKVA